jgi:hypothetical protein
MKAMRRRLVTQALRRAGCLIKTDDGPHTADIPRHVDISPGVIRDTINRMTCLPKGWLQ